MLILISVAFAVPLFVALINAVKPASQSGVQYMWQLPHSLDFSSIRQAFGALAPSFGNSLVITLGSTVLIVIFASVNGYILAKLKFRGADVIMLLLMFGMFIPYQVVLTPLVHVLAALGLYNSLLGLSLVHFIYGLPLATLIFRNFYAAIPDEILQAAEMDGADQFRVFLDVVLPLSGPGILVVFIYQFTNVWNDFLFGLVVVPNPALQPMTVALNNVSSAMNIQWNVVMAASILASIPTIIVYIIFGRMFVSGLMAGALK